MKFANIIFNKRGEEITIGDDIQLLAIENLYHYMGIDYDDVIRIERTDLQTYDGEDVILPISFPFTAYYDDFTITCFSEKITPVFLGLCIFSQELNKKDVEYLKRFAPIGCRDEYTLKTMRKYHIPAYLNGCMTLGFQKSNQPREKLTRIFCIDVQEELIPYIPEHLLKFCEFSSHTYFRDDIKEAPEEYARKVYNKYRDEAKLVITSRLHAAIPCMAAGIPVIFAKDIFSYRFAGVDRIAKIYDANEFDNIDWNPVPIEYEYEKRQLLDLAAERILSIYRQSQKLTIWDNFMHDKMERKWYVEFLDNSIEYIQTHWKKEDKVTYALWGITQIATNLHDFIEKNYPNAELKAIVDRDKRVSLYGIKSEGKSVLEDQESQESLYVFICTGAAVQEAKEYLPKIGIGNFYNCCEVVSISK